MTPRQGQAAAFVCLVLGILGVWLSKRPTTDIAAGVLGGAGFLLFMAPSVLRWHGNKQSRERVARHRRAEQETPWTVYSRPMKGEPTMWEVGIERRVGGSRVVLATEPPDAVLDPDDVLEIQIAAEMAKSKAARWNESKVGM